eukprot:COSAG02_NODE_71730_length_189_cov_2760.144444_1_plen_39_part_10
MEDPLPGAPRWAKSSKDGFAKGCIILRHEGVAVNLDQVD